MIVEDEAARRPQSRPLPDAIFHGLEQRLGAAISSDPEAFGFERKGDGLRHRRVVIDQKDEGRDHHAASAQAQPPLGLSNAQQSRRARVTTRQLA
ncbi:MAG: hypothetical protein A2795_14570 [Caulobacterales bacterium RIFCSPHIGHO2_01_FULL_67_30]|jgi:hypothetical protein|nr:MAG: hypothetical protein A2795_14570 [Caulobacterales bacterium RIFCSPHIGHO2_01_FULL_67_30]